MLRTQWRESLGWLQAHACELEAAVESHRRTDALIAVRVDVKYANPCRIDGSEDIQHCTHVDASVSVPD